MDPTNPKDNSTQPSQTPDQAPSTNPWSNTSPAPTKGQDSQTPSLIQPGQFVSFGKEPPPASTSPDQTYNAPVSNSNLPPLPNTPPPSSGPILGATQVRSQAPNPIDIPPPSTPQFTQTPPSSPTPVVQPDPTPYVPPQTNQFQPETPPNDSRIKKLRIIAIIVGALVLIAIAGALLWFFVFRPMTNKAAKTQSNEAAAELNEPPPVPKNTQGGFGELPQATAPASSTQSAQ